MPLRIRTQRLELAWGSRRDFPAPPGRSFSRRFLWRRPRLRKLGDMQLPLATVFEPGIGLLRNSVAEETVDCRREFTANAAVRRLRFVSSSPSWQEWPGPSRTTETPVRHDATSQWQPLIEAKTLLFHGCPRSPSSRAEVFWLRVGFSLEFAPLPTSSETFMASRASRLGTRAGGKLRLLPQALLQTKTLNFPAQSKEI